MREAGFATAAFVGAIVLDRQYGLDRGFDSYDDDMAPRHAAGDTGFSERRADRVIDSALAWLEGAPERFFAWVHLYDPHANYDPPAGFRAAFPDDPYAGEVAFVDAQLGRLLEALDQRWPGPGTLVVVTADHGESLGEHGELTDSLGIYEATQRVPLLMAGASLPAGTVVPAPVSLVDVAPTILASSGAAALPDGDGVDLRRVVLAGADRGEPAYMETVVTQLDLGWSPLLGLRTDRYKYIRAPRPELYDLAEDPAELRDLSADRPALVRELDQVLERRLARAPTLAPELSPDAETRDRLAALGYVVQPDGPGAAGIAVGRVGGADPKDEIPQVRRLMRAMILRGQGRPRAALEELASFPDPGSSRVESLRADASFDAGDFEAAERHARAVLALRPGMVDVQVRLAEAIESQGRLDEAERLYAEAAESDPAIASPLVGLGRIAELRGDRDEAAELYRAASERRSRSAEALWRLAALRMEDGGDAGALLASLSEEELTRPKAALRLAAAERAAGRDEAARRRLRRSAAANPTAPSVRAALAELAVEK